MAGPTGFITTRGFKPVPSALTALSGFGDALQNVLEKRQRQRSQQLLLEQQQAFRREEAEAGRGFRRRERLAGEEFQTKLFERRTKLDKRIKAEEAIDAAANAALLQADTPEKVAEVEADRKRRKAELDKAPPADVAEPDVVPSEPQPFGVVPGDIAPQRTFDLGGIPGVTQLPPEQQVPLPPIGTGALPPQQAFPDFGGVPLVDVRGPQPEQQIQPLTLAGAEPSAFEAMLRETPTGVKPSAIDTLRAEAVRGVLEAEKDQARAAKLQIAGAEMQALNATGLLKTDPRYQEAAKKILSRAFEEPEILKTLELAGEDKKILAEPIKSETGQTIFGDQDQRKLLALEQKAKKFGAFADTPDVLQAQIKALEVLKSETFLKLDQEDAKKAVSLLRKFLGFSDILQDNFIQGGTNAVYGSPFGPGEIFFTTSGILNAKKGTSQEEAENTAILLTSIIDDLEDLGIDID